MSWQTVLIQVCLVFAAFAAGAWLGQREEKQRHRQPLRNWRV